MKRGAITVAFNPTAIFWHALPIPLSPFEAQLYAFIAKRGRVLNDDIDLFLESIGASVATRALILGHIRRKFIRMGACDPFQRVGNTGLRLQVDEDAFGNRQAIIGEKMPRYARISR